MEKKRAVIIGAAALAGVAVIGGGLWFALGLGGSGSDENVVY